MYSANTSPKKSSLYQSGAAPSPRASPFKRPTSANSQPNTPDTLHSPSNTRVGASRQGIAGQGPSTPTRNPAPIDEEDTENSDVFTAPSYPTQRPSSRGAPSPSMLRGMPQKQLHRNASPEKADAPIHKANSSGSGEAAAKVAPGLLREMHESFQAMDGDGDGAVGATDVAEALAQLGQNAHPATLTTFFPPNTSGSIGLPAYINALSEPLSAMGQPAELAAAFSAFDADDSGQIDVAELREALLASHDGGPSMTAAQVDAVLGEFSGKRAFAKGAVGNRGDVFRWREFVHATSGGSEEKDEVRA